MQLRIKEAIAERGYTLRSVADALGIARQSLHSIVKNGNPSIGTLDAIAKAIGAPITALYTEEEGIYINAMVTHRGKFYHAQTLERLEEIVETIRTISQEQTTEEVEEQE